LRKPKEVLIHSSGEEETLTKRARTSSSALKTHVTCLANESSARDPERAPSAAPLLAKTLDRSRDISSFFAPLVHVKLAPALPTVVYNTYWRFAAERQAIFFRRFAGAPAPWTNDPILQQYKFTNAYRASDRVSQYLIREVIYKGDQSPLEVFFRTLLFKTFNRIETWELLAKAFGEVRHDCYRFRDYDELLTVALESGRKIYSAAYIMPTGGPSFRESRKHRTHLRLIGQMMNDRVPERVAAMRGMMQVFELLKSYHTIGDFLAYQYTTDLNYSGITNFSEVEFVIPGPGAREGLRKCFVSRGGLTESDMIRFVTDRQDEEFARLGLSFQSLWGRPLQYIDCQNLFCEVDKYSRVFHPEIAGSTGRSRIKQQFTPARTALSYWYPPKWGINQRIKAETSALPPDSSLELFPSKHKTAREPEILSAAEEQACTL
jgi:hypothetical protein